MTLTYQAVAVKITRYILVILLKSHNFPKKFCDEQNSTVVNILNGIFSKSTHE